MMKEKEAGREAGRKAGSRIAYFAPGMKAAPFSGSKKLLSYRMGISKEERKLCPLLVFFIFLRKERSVKKGSPFFSVLFVFCLLCLTYPHSLTNGKRKGGMKAPFCIPSFIMSLLIS